MNGACMTSPFSAALTKLDGSLGTVQSQLDGLRAGLEVNGDQLSRSLTDARQHAAVLRRLIRAERPAANWSDRKALDELIHELEIAAKARRNEQRRTKLLELAHELDAGRAKHRFDARTAALNTLRLQAVEELRTEAALPEQLKDLPGPDASAWMHWACSLQDTKDALVLSSLCRDFCAVEHFAGEMEESYWIPGKQVCESSGKPSEPSVQPGEEPTCGSPGCSSSEPDAPASTDQDNVAQDVCAQLDKAAQIGNSAQALHPGSERQTSEASSVPVIVLRPQAAKRWRPPTVAVHRHPSDIKTVEASQVKYCDKCGSSYPSEFNVCPIDSSRLRAASESTQDTTSGDTHLILKEADEEGARVPTGGESVLSSARQSGTMLLLDPADLQPAGQPSLDSSTKPDNTDWVNLKETLEWRLSAAEQVSPGFGERVVSIFRRDLPRWIGKY
jgi:hypothetical protein